MSRHQRSAPEPPMPQLAAEELHRMSEAFAEWAAKDGLLSRVTPEQCADLARAFAAGCTYALEADRKMWAKMWAEMWADPSGWAKSAPRRPSR